MGRITLSFVQFYSLPIWSAQNLTTSFPFFSFPSFPFLPNLGAGLMGFKSKILHSDYITSIRLYNNSSMSPRFHNAKISGY